ncbi:hypothetical protein KCP76_17910 [Salmonella enterica subsp. enterica serovar Weltevreden]|nr:hypothetical protein KCP76_17910 [Salmonella enterica subsp. enterica serovar Weltevreden]
MPSVGLISAAHQAAPNARRSGIFHTQIAKGAASAPFTLVSYFTRKPLALFGPACRKRPVVSTSKSDPNSRAGLNLPYRR